MRARLGMHSHIDHYLVLEASLTYIPATEEVRLFQSV